MENIKQGLNMIFRIFAFFYQVVGFFVSLILALMVTDNLITFLDFLATKPYSHGVFYVLIVFLIMLLWSFFLISWPSIVVNIVYVYYLGRLHLYFDGDIPDWAETTPNDGVILLLGLWYLVFMSALYVIYT